VFSRIDRHGLGIGITHGVGCAPSAAGIGFTTVQHKGIVHGQTARIHFQTHSRSLHLRCHLYREAQQVIAAGTDFIHFQITLVRTRDHLHATVGTISVINSQPDSRHVRALNTVPIGV
ncbi:uncharacterized protein METZ01_LOCUS372961, partial [marine metagenome]